MGANFLAWIVEEGALEGEGVEGNIHNIHAPNY